VARYLSPEWLAELARAIKNDGLAVPTGAAPLVVAVHVADAPQGPVDYELEAANGRITLRTEIPHRADVTLSVDFATARSIATGMLNAQTAFLAGTARLTGELTRLIECQPIFNALETALATLRDHTEFD